MSETASGQARVRTVPLAELKAAPYNPREISPAALAGLKASIARFGLVQPIVVNKRTGLVVGGHQRVRALSDAGAADALVLEVDLPVSEEKALNLALNSRHIEGDWTEALGGLLGEVKLDLPDLFVDLRLGELLGDVPKSAIAIVEDEVPEPPKVPVTKPGDLWTLGRHRLLCGDSSDADDLARAMNGEAADLGVTSPPYNQQIEKFKPSGMHRRRHEPRRRSPSAEAWVEKVARLAYADSLPEPEYQDSQRRALAAWFGVMRDGGSFFYNHKNRYRDKEVVSPLSWLPGPFKLRQEIVWSRPGGIAFNATMFLPSDERIYWLYRGERFFFENSTEVKSWATVWRIGLETNKDHPVAFPVELPSRCIRACSRVGEIVLEPCAGSGTTVSAAEQLDRRCFGLEIEPRFCDVIVQRWEALTGGKATRETVAA